MAVWATALFQRDEYPTDAYGGTFTAKAPAGLLPDRPPFFAVYPITTLGGASGGSLAGQGGGIIVF